MKYNCVQAALTKSAAAIVGLAVILSSAIAGAATLTVQTFSPGPTPDVVGYNSGHFFPGSNTREWMRYSGVSGLRLFFPPSEIEATDDIAPVGDGVSSLATFLARRAAIRTNQFNPSYINWSYFSNRYESNDLYPNNHIRPNFALTELRKLNIKPLIQITASESRLPISGTNDWANMWELWQHFYVQAFYLGRVFDVDRYQMFNEPNHASAGITITNFLIRLQLASDAVQTAIADVNSLYGKSLSPKMLAPVTSGTADGSYTGWGKIVVTNRHNNFFGSWDTNFSLIQTYDYHEYGQTPSAFGSDLANLHGLMTTDMTPEPRYPTSISEFNTETGATFDTLIETLDSPTEYALFGAISVRLLVNSINELYAFKFSQTAADPANTYPVVKNAMHYVDNSNSPYNVGGITKAGEVWRLFNKAFAPGRARINVTKGTGATSLDVSCSRDPAENRFYLYSANNSSGGVALDINLSAWNIPAGNRVLIEEVSEACYGATRLWTNLSAGKIVSLTQNGYTVLLLTVSSNSPQSELTLNATDDAEVRDGTNKTANYGASSTMTVRNDPANTANRSAAFIKFQLPTNDLATLEFAELSLQASSATVNTTAQAHVYGLTNTTWTQGAINWSNAPGLKQNITAGNTIANNFVKGLGTNVSILGQMVANSTGLSEKLIDVTDFIRSRGSNAPVSFLISQDPRWDVTLPSLAAGDTQPDGVAISTTEGGNPPRLKLVFRTPAPPNTPPVATNDAFTTLEDTPLTVPAAGVLTNDFDADSDPLTAVLVSSVSHGLLTLNGNGSFTYTPATNYFGPDSFTYKANDGITDSAPATVAITVTSVNDIPIAVTDNVTTTQNVAVAFSVIVNDYDVDGGTVLLVSITQPAHGVSTNNGNGTVTYTPSPGYTGADSFNYTITDGQGGTNTGLVSVNVLSTAVVPVWTNLIVAVEANIRGGASAASDVDEATNGYVMVKYSTTLDNARKAYFQFDVTGLNVDVTTQATFAVNFTVANQQRVQLWGLNQSYAAFTPSVTWNGAQANDTNSNDLLAVGTLTGNAVGSSVLIPASGTTPFAFVITNIGNFIRGNRVTLALSGVADATNNTGGLRIQRTNARLQVLVFASAITSSNPPVITSIVANPNGSVTMNILGEANRTHWLQARTNLAGGTWLNISTNVSGTNGAWSVTDFSTANCFQRFYRVVLP